MFNVHSSFSLVLALSHLFGISSPSVGHKILFSVLWGVCSAFLRSLLTTAIQMSCDLPHTLLAENPCPAYFKSGD